MLFIEKNILYLGLPKLYRSISQLNPTEMQSATFGHSLRCKQAKHIKSYSNVAENTNFHHDLLQSRREVVFEEITTINAAIELRTIGIL